MAEDGGRTADDGRQMAEDRARSLGSLPRFVFPLTYGVIIFFSEGNEGFPEDRRQRTEDGGLMTDLQTALWGTLILSYTGN